MFAAAAAGLVWANSPWWETYEALSGAVLGPTKWGLALPLSSWAVEGMLAVFFFVVGVELKHELVAGSLRRPKEAAVPVLAAVGGMILPAVVFTALVVGLGNPGALHGWAIPTATDVAFALAVLAMFGRGLPHALRAFLLTLAVVDDFLAVIVITVFYTSNVDLFALAVALVAVVVFGLLVRLRSPHWWLFVPVALVAWGAMHASGVHATIAGVLLGFTVPARAIYGESWPRTHRFDKAIRPLSSVIALPVFAFFSAGVRLVDRSSPAGILSQPVLVAVVMGLVVGKVVGVLGTTALMTRITPLRLSNGVGLRDLLPIGFLTGIGFTVSLLITELSFTDVERIAAAKLGILIATILSATLGAATLRWDFHKARRNKAPSGA